MDPDLARPAELATDLDHRAIALLLRRRHLVIGDLGVTAKGWRTGHFGSPSQVNWRRILLRRCPPCRPAGTRPATALRTFGRVALWATPYRHHGFNRVIMVTQPRRNIVSRRRLLGFASGAAAFTFWDCKATGFPTAERYVDRVAAERIAD